MSNVISLKLEVYNFYGGAVATYTKNVESDFTPHKDMIFEETDYTLTAKNIYFDLADGRVFVRFVEHLRKDEQEDVWDFLKKHDWKKVK